MSKHIISKELLSEVLNGNFEVNYILDSDIVLYHNNICVGKEINIYELAHKCKEWAYRNSYTVWSGLHCFAYIQKHYNEEEEIFSCKGNTEPEAIFKACQWILENKEQK